MRAPRPTPQRPHARRIRGSIPQWALPLALVGVLTFLGATTLGDGVASMFKRISACVASPANCRSK